MPYPRRPRPTHRTPPVGAPAKVIRLLPNSYIIDCSNQKNSPPSKLQQPELNKVIYYEKVVQWSRNFGYNIQVRNPLEGLQNAGS